MQVVGCSTLHNISIPEEPSSTFSFPWSSDSRASYLLYKGSWKGEVGREGIGLPQSHFYSSPSLRSHPSAWW